LLNLGGENTAALARVVQSIPGRGKQVVQSALDEQAVGVPELVTSGVEKAIGKKIPSRVARQDELTQEAATVAKPHYDAIRNLPIESAKLEELMQRPAMVDAIRHVHRNLSNAGSAIPDGPNLGVMDSVKKMLDSEIETISEKIAAGKASAPEKEGRHALVALRNELVSALDESVADYAKARGVAEKVITTREAFRSGTGALTRKGDDLADEVGRHTPEDRAAMLEGAATDLQERVTSRNPTNAAGVFDPKARRNLDIITEGTPAKDVIRETYGRANKINQQARASTMRGQATTASTTRGQQDLDDAVGSPLEGVMKIGGKAISGRWWELAADAVRAANARHVRGVTSSVAGDAADILTQKLDDPKASELARALVERVLRERGQRTGAAIRRTGSGVAVGSGAANRRQ
jgi:hypothetical protein